MPYRHLIAATVITLGVCQGHYRLQAFSTLTSTSRGPSAIAELFKIATFHHLQLVSRISRSPKMTTSWSLSLHKMWWESI